MASRPFLFFFLLFFSLFGAALPQSPPIKGHLLDCGAAATTTTTDSAGLEWVPDAPFTSSAGTAKSLSIPGLAPLLSTLRSFPFRPSDYPRKFCYTLPVHNGTRYLVRTTYYYGGVNGQDSPPVFDQIVDGTFWTVVNTTVDYANGVASNYEAVFMAKGKYMKVCVAGNTYTDSDLFINALEMIELEDSVYNATDFSKNALGLIARSRFGYSGNIVRYPEDRFDRYWLPFVGNLLAANSRESISTSVFWNLPPSNIFETALTTAHDTRVEFQWPPISLPNSSYYIALYFADNSSGSSRTFDVYVNGYAFYSNLNVTSSGLAVFATQWNLSGLTTIVLSSQSLPPPIINAGEIFGIFSLGGITHTRDVRALEGIKSNIENPPLDWNGDPCLPREYSWSGVKCSNPSEGPNIRVVSLNLSSMGLSGSLPPSIDLTALTDLLFANNNMSGHIPDLSRLKRLKKLHFQDNELTGDIPPSLGKLEHLREVLLQNNNLTGIVPPSLVRPGVLNLRLSPGNPFLLKPPGSF